MRTDVTKILAAPSKDPAIGKKYLITFLASALSFLLVPAVLLVGYLANTIEHVSTGKKDLPEWKDPAALGMRGAVCALTGLYMLPAAIILAISVITAGTGQKFLGISMLTLFISLGGLVLGFIGLSLAATGIHTYVHSNNFSDLFHLPNIITKIRSKIGPVGNLFGAVGLITLALSVLNTWLGMIGGVISVAGSAFLSLALAYGVGAIYGVPEVENEGDSPSIGPAAENVLLPEEASPTSEMPSSTPEEPSLSQGEWAPDTSEEETGWKPK